MILDKMFLQNDILGAAMQASIVRNEVINNNLANAETPGFKKKTVVFESYLRDALANNQIKSAGDLKNISPSIWVTHSQYDYRIDGNNVDPETEMVDLYQNSVRYDTLASAVINNYKRINAVLSAIK